MPTLRLVSGFTAQFMTGFLLISLAGASLVATVMPHRAYAAEPTLDRLQSISSHCTILKTRLNSAQKNEAADRIKRGRAYDQDLLPYISAFNSRVAASKLDAPELISIAADLQTVVGRSQFGGQYTTYADDLTSASKVDCKASPADMNDWIDKSRLDRATLSDSVKQADTLLTNYINELEKLQQRLTPVINNGSADTNQGSN